MARFGNVAELATFRGKLDADYAKYAPALWQKGIKTPRQLADFSEPHYLACDAPEGHIDDINARADTTGDETAHEQAGPSKKARTGAKTALDGRHIPVSLEAFDEADSPDVLIPESTGGLSHISSLVEDVPFHGGEELTTGMMHAFIPVAMKSLLKKVSLPGSDHYLRFDYSGNKTEKGSSNPSGVLSRKLDRPDMLLVSGGATVLVGEDKVSMNVWQLCSISPLVTVLMPHSGLSDVDMEVYECRL
ncbi:TPA: hypothetical protein ACH3X1_011850 [Trebouxia sp. C0004]